MCCGYDTAYNIASRDLETKMVNNIDKLRLLMDKRVLEYRLRMLESKMRYASKDKLQSLRKDFSRTQLEITKINTILTDK